MGSGSNALWAVVFGFFAGVFLRSFFLVGSSAIAFFALLGLCSTLLSFLDRKNIQRTLFVALACFSCAAGVARMQSAAVTGDPQLTSRIGATVEVQGEVIAEPDARDTITLVTVDATQRIVGSATLPVRSGILVELPAHGLIAYGDVVQVSGKLELPQPFDTGDGRQFEYPDYLADQGVAYQLGYAQVDSVLGNAGEPLQAFAIAAKETFLSALGLVMPDPEAALAGGITVGDKRSIGPQLTSDFQKDSLVHMVVLSGYNITVVLNAVTKLLSFAPRYVGYGSSVITVIFFIFMSGGASSATRAGLMALIATLARATHRVYLGEHVLATASFLMVAWDPWTLCFDPSFQLSALATLGLIFFTPTFAALFSRVPESFGAREILASTCATQLTVLPFLLYQSGTLSLVALPANLLALLPVPLAMLCSSIAAACGMIFGTSAAIVSLPAYALLWYIISVAHFFASLPFAAVSVPAFDASWLCAAYALLATLHMFTKKKATGG